MCVNCPKHTHNETTFRDHISLFQLQFRAPAENTYIEVHSQRNKFPVNLHLPSPSSMQAAKHNNTSA